MDEKKKMNFPKNWMTYDSFPHAFTLKREKIKQRVFYVPFKRVFFSLISLHHHPCVRKKSIKRAWATPSFSTPHWLSQITWVFLSHPYMEQGAGPKEGRNVWERIRGVEWVLRVHSAGDCGGEREVTEWLHICGVFSLRSSLCDGRLFCFVFLSEEGHFSVSKVNQSCFLYSWDKT